MVAYFKSATSAEILVASKLSILALLAVNVSFIVTLSAVKVSISAFAAFNVSFMVTFSETKLSILPRSASSSLTLTLSAITISNSDILLPIVSTLPSTSLTSSVLADGDDTLPVMVAV